MRVVAADPRVNFYSVFGYCLATPVEFPELRPVACTEPRWTFEVLEHLPEMVTPVELGAEEVYRSVFARLYRHANGVRIIVDDTGDFNIDGNGRVVHCSPRGNAWPDFIRGHLLGRVCATALYLDGMMPLHGSAVAFASGAAAFLAPKGFGKSTLALALTLRGARLLTDDTLPVEFGDVPHARPGVHTMRVTGASAAALGADRSGPATRDGKALLADLSDARLAHAPVPLASVYIMEVLAGADAPAQATRMQLPGTIAALAIVSHAKIARMLGAGAAPVLLDRAATLVRSVPVYSLAIPRDLDLIDESAAIVAGWHGANAPSANALA